MLEKKYNQLNEQIDELQVIIKYNNKIDIIYETGKDGTYNIFGEKFDKII